MILAILIFVAYESAYSCHVFCWIRMSLIAVFPLYLDSFGMSCFMCEYTSIFVVWLISLLYLWERHLTFSIAVLKKPASVILCCLKVYQVWSLQVWIIFQAITVNVTNWSLSAEYYVLSFGVLINLLVASGFMKTSYRIRSLGYPMPPPLVLECKFFGFYISDVPCSLLYN